MIAPAPSSLSPDILACRLRELVSHERGVQVEFLLHLDEFDRRRAFLEAGYESLWTYCLQTLHLREGPAGRRIGAMRVLRRFSALEGALRDGRLCLSTVTVLGPLLTDENLEDLVGRAAYRTKAEVEHLAASLQPRKASKEGIRRLAGRSQAAQERTLAPTMTPTAESAAPLPDPLPASRGEGDGNSTATPTPSPQPFPPLGERERDSAANRRPRVELRPVSADQWSMRVTLDKEMKANLETLASLLSHAKGSDLGAVLHEAIRCGIEKHGKRKGAVAPARTRAVPERNTADAASPGTRTAIPAQVRREVWLRDGGRCTWKGADGHRCDGRWKLEFDHIRPVALGGASTTDNVRILCKRHNLLHAEQTFGREHMARFAGAQLILG
jgi:hypothetical protein